MPQIAVYAALNRPVCEQSSDLCSRGLGYEAIKQGKEVLYRSIFDLVRDFMKDAAK